MKITGQIISFELKPLPVGMADEKQFTLTIHGRMKSEQARELYEAFRGRNAAYVEQLTPRGLEVRIEVPK